MEEKRATQTSGVEYKTPKNWADFAACPKCYLVLPIRLFIQHTQECEGDQADNEE